MAKKSRQIHEAPDWPKSLAVILIINFTVMSGNAWACQEEDEACVAAAFDRYSEPDSTAGIDLDLCFSSDQKLGEPCGTLATFPLKCCDTNLSCVKTPDNIDPTDWVCFPALSFPWQDGDQCLAAHSNSIKPASGAVFYGHGFTADANVSYTIEQGGVYGSDGSYGCYETTCYGVSGGLGAVSYNSKGTYDAYEDFEGESFSLVGGAGFGLEFFYTKIFAAEYGTNILGSAYGLSIGVSDPLALGEYYCTTAVNEVVVGNTPPVADANGPYVEECNGATTAVSMDGTGSYDPDPSDTIAYSWDSDCLGNGFDDPSIPVPVLTMDTMVLCEETCSVSLIVSDDDGESDVSSTSVTVQDSRPPEIIECNAPSNIVPPDAPISFTATAMDVCDSAPSIEIIGFDCFKYTKKEKLIDKTQSCVVDVVGDTINILDSGGVGDNITWTVRATDRCGNSTEKICAVSVVNPGRF